MAKDRLDREERKALRGPDEFVTTATNVFEWAQSNLRTVIAVAVGLVAVFLGIGLFTSYQSAQRREANADLAAGLDAFRGGDFDEAAAELETLAKRDTGVAPLAAIVAANSQLRAGDADGAIASLQTVDLAQLPRYLRQQHELAWGNALEAKGDLAGAAAKYSAAANAEGPYTGEALVDEARVRNASGEAAAAEELYRKALDEFPERTDRQFLEAQAG